MIAPVGRADLLRLLRGQPDDDPDGIGEFLGYELKREERCANGSSTAVVAVAVGPSKHESSSGQRNRARFWRAGRFAPDDGEQPAKPQSPTPGDRPKPLTSADFLHAEDARFPLPEPLLPWPQLHRRIRHLLTTLRESRTVDIAALVTRVGRGEANARLPMTPVVTMARRVWLVIDRHERLAPFWSDQDHLVRRLDRMLGMGGIVVEVASDVSEIIAVSRRLKLATGDTVLALTDLGAYANKSVVDVWMTAGGTLRANGARLAALLPCPRGRWPDNVGDLWNGQVWDRAAGDMRRTEGECAARAQHLLQLCSPLLRVEPGLLRALRLLLSAEQVDAGTEADLWNHVDVERKWTSFCWVTEAAAPRLRAAWAAASDEMKQRYLAVLRQWREGTTVPPHLMHLERAWVAAFGAGHLMSDLELSETSRFHERWAAMTELGSMEPWFEECKQATPDVVWRDARVGPSLRRAWLKHRRNHDETLPSGVRLSELTPTAPPRELRSWIVGQRAATLLTDQYPADGLRQRPRWSGSPVLTSQTDSDGAVWETDAGVGSAINLFSNDTPATSNKIELVSARVEIATREGRWTLNAITCPEWAAAIGRDRYGLWVDVVTAGVTQRMRWIPPGRFQMGSPQSETGRYEDEGPLHEVIVTNGFWLADTPVTQELWQAVMGNNPSRFRSPDRPVDSVSWNDAKAFLAKTNGLRLPHEGEWEYACRAGTVTSTWAGELEILGQNNAPLLDDIAWYGGNSGVDFDLNDGHDSSGWSEKQYPHERAGTRPVKLKRANPHGLYDMLGNVWEWCEDLKAPYTGVRKVDPAGPREGSSRVLRGGSWLGLARICRSAYRYGSVPSLRSGFVGFRLARGQGLLKAGAEPRDEAKRERGAKPRDEA